MSCHPSPSGLAALALLLGFLSTAFILARRQWTRRDKDWRISVHYDAAMEAARLLKDWCAWLASIATASIAANGFLVRQGDNSGICNAGAFAVLAIVAFLCSILATATLLLALPSVVARFSRKRPSRDNDFYEAQAFVWPSTSVGQFTPLFRVGFIAALQYLCFVFGVISFAVYAALMG
nr:hypothetical protein [uncultured Albidiferax sp.]